MNMCRQLCSRRPGSQAGFTLLEVLLTLGLLALVLSLVQGAYSGVVRTEQGSRVLTEQAHASTVMVHRIADELSMAFFDPNRPDDTTGLFVETDLDGLSSLAFTSRVPPIYGFSRGGDSEIRYVVEAGPDDSLRLTREHSDLDGAIWEGGEPFAMLEGIRRFEVRCSHHDLSEEWVDNWSSTLTTDLPDSVEITVGWEEADAGSDEETVQRVFRTRTRIYARQ